MSLDNKRLTRRYLLWCYKTTKEDFERIERKFTQLEVDDFLLKDLNQQAVEMSKDERDGFQEKVDEFEAYIKRKADAALAEKHLGDPNKLNPQYSYLKGRLQAVEKAIEKFLGKKELEDIKLLYQAEFEKRILEAREHS